MLRHLLNARRWRDHDLHLLELTVRHRGAPRDERVITGADIAEICRGGVFLHAPDGKDPDCHAFLPWHRILTIRAPTGELWRRST